MTFWSFYLGSLVVANVAYWPYSAYWWGRGKLKAVERIRAMTPDGRAQAVSTLEVRLSLFRALLWLLPFATAFMVWTWLSGFCPVLLPIGGVLAWLTFFDSYRQTRHTVRALAKSTTTTTTRLA